MAESTDPGPIFDTDGTTPLNYIVIIDAGSTRSEINIYTYPDTKDVQKEDSDSSSERLRARGSKRFEQSQVYDSESFRQSPADNSTILDKPLEARADSDSDSRSFLPKITQQNNKWSFSVKPGLDSFLNNQKKIAPDHLKPLLDYAKSIVPSSQQYRTPIFLHGTGGMRVLRPTDANTLLLIACQYIQQKSYFFIPSCRTHVNLIDGEMHGIFGWTAVNYLAGTLEVPRRGFRGKGPSTYGFLDMGGASTQVTFVPNATEIEQHSNSLFTANLPSLEGNHDLSFQISSSSYLRYGVNEIQNQVVNTFLDVRENPCAPRGLSTVYDVSTSRVVSFQPKDTDSENGRKVQAGQDTRSGYTQLTGIGSFDLCQESMIPFVVNMRSGTSPRFNLVDHFVGVSEYWETMHDGFQMDNGKFDVEELKSKVKMFCDSDWKSIDTDYTNGQFPGLDRNRLYDLCFRSTWVLTVVEYGLKLANTRQKRDSLLGSDNDTDKPYEFSHPLQSVSDINGMKYSWTLGRALYYATGEQSKSRRAHEAGIIANVNIESQSFRYGVRSMPRPAFQYLDNYNFPAHSRQNAKWDNFLKSHTHKVWGSLAFLFILVVIFYLLLGRMRRRQIWQSVRTYVPFANRYAVTNPNGRTDGTTVKRSAVGVLIGSLLAKLPFFSGSPMYQASSKNIRVYQRMNSEPVEDLELGVLDEIPNEFRVSTESEERVGAAER